MGSDKPPFVKFLEACFQVLDCYLDKFRHPSSRQVLECIGNGVSANGNETQDDELITCHISAFFAVLTGLFLPAYLPVQMFLIVRKHFSHHHSY